MNWTEEKINEIYEAAMRAAMTDEEFRAELLKEPVASIEKLTGVKIPEGFNLKVLEEEPDYDMTILLPPMADDNLSEEELEQVSGGGVSTQILAQVAKKVLDDVIRENGGKK